MSDTPPDWDFILTDLQGVVLGDIVGASDRQVVLPHMRTPTASFTVPLWHPRATDLLTKDCLLQCYRRDSFGSKLVFNGPILGVEESGEALGQTIACSAVGPFWRLTKRVIGQTTAGIILPGGTQQAPTTASLATIAHSVIDLANGAWYTGIKKGTITNNAGIGVGSAVYPDGLKIASDIIQDLVSAVNSFDYVITPLVPQTPTVNGFPTIAQMDCAPLIGAVRPNAIFEYGTPRANVVSYKRSITREDILNRAIVSLSGWPDGLATGQGLVVSQDGTSKTNRGLFEEVVSDAGVIDATLRQGIADDHIKYRKDPRQRIIFTPKQNTRPTPFTDYNVGDWVRARASVRGSVRFDSTFRIWGASFTLDQNGNETVELQLTQDTS